VILWGCLTTYSGDAFRTTPLMFSMWPCKSKLDQEKSKCVGLVQQNGFGPTFLHILLKLVQGITKFNSY
jgi:hypothetical protein